MQTSSTRFYQRGKGRVHYPFNHDIDTINNYNQIVLYVPQLEHVSYP